MRRQEPAAIIILPFHAHLPCTIPICKFLERCLQLYAKNDIHLVHTGLHSLGFVPDASFFEGTLQQINMQLIGQARIAGNRVSGVFPKVEGTALLIYIFAYWSGRSNINQTVNIVRADRGGTESLRTGLMISFEQICRELNPSPQADISKLLSAANYSQELEEAMIGIGITLAQSGSLAEARACWIETLSSVNSRSFSAALNIGQSYSDEQNFEEAMDWFTTAIELTSEAADEALCYYNRGTAYAASDRREKATQDFLRVIQLSPDLGMAYNNLGACYMEIGDRNQARKWFEACCSLERDTSVSLGLEDAKELALLNLTRL
jgi:tetratricopeptide (TPR) repeat protein